MGLSDAGRTTLSPRINTPSTVVNCSRIAWNGPRSPVNCSAAFFSVTIFMTLASTPSLSDSARTILSVSGVMFSSTSATMISSSLSALMSSGSALGSRDKASATTFPSPGQYSTSKLYAARRSAHRASLIDLRFGPFLPNNATKAL